MKAKFIYLGLALGLSFWACGSANNEPVMPNNNGGSSSNTVASLSDEDEDDAPPPKPREKAPSSFTEAKARQTIEAYCSTLSSGDYEGFGQLFAPEVKRWLSMKNTNPKAVSAEAKRFLGSKNNVRYATNMSSFKAAGAVYSVRLEVSWDGYSASVDALFEFDDEARILNYSEKNAKVDKRPSKVKGKLGGLAVFSLPFNPAKHQVDQNYYQSTMGASEAMAPFEYDFNSLPTQLYGKIQVSPKVWLVVADQSYRFYSAYGLVTYTEEGEMIDAFGEETDKYPVINKDLSFKASSGTYKISPEGKFVRQ